MVYLHWHEDLKRPNILLKVTRLVRKEKGRFAKLTIARTNHSKQLYKTKMDRTNAPNHFLETKFADKVLYSVPKKHSPTYDSKHLYSAGHK